MPKEMHHLIINDVNYEIVDEVARHPDWHDITDKPFDEMEFIPVYEELWSDSGMTDSYGYLNIEISDKTLFEKISTEESYKITVNGNSDILKPVWSSDASGTSKIFPISSYGWSVVIRINNYDDSHHVILRDYTANTLAEITIEEVSGGEMELKKLEPSYIDIDALKIALNL